MVIQFACFRLLATQLAALSISHLAVDRLVGQEHQFGFRVPYRSDVLIARRHFLQRHRQVSSQFPMSSSVALVQQRIQYPNLCVVGSDALSDSNLLLQRNGKGAPPLPMAAQIIQQLAYAQLGGINGRIVPS